MPYDVREEAVTARQNARYNGFAHSFAGMGLQFMLFAAISQRDVEQTAMRRPRSVPAMYEAAAAQELLHRRSLMLAARRA